MKVVKFWSNLCVLSLTAGIAHPQTAQDEEPVISTYTMPEVERAPKLAFPSSLKNSGQEGMVQLNVMVGTDGRVFEPSVVFSTGDPAFQQEALAALAEMQFKPAMLNGEPTASSYPFIIRFNLDPPPTGARTSFVRNYRKFVNLLQDEGQDEARSALDKLGESGATNHYENAFLNFAMYLYSQKYGTKSEQMDFLWAALDKASSEDDRIYLPEESRLVSLRQLFSLQVANSRMKEAVKTFELLVALGDEEGTVALRSAYDRLLALEHDATAYETPGTIADAGSWNIELLKHHVYVDRVDGALKEFKLRCSNHYVGFAIEPLISYEVPEDWGDCSLEVIGDAGTSFALVQH